MPFNYNELGLGLKIFAHCEILAYRVILRIGEVMDEYF